ALSRQIRDLEDEIGFSLLKRTAKSVRLMDAGREFLDNARGLLQSADDAVTKARAVASAEPTELRSCTSLLSRNEFRSVSSEQKADSAQPQKNSGSAPKKLRQTNSSPLIVAFSVSAFGLLEC